MINLFPTPIKIIKNNSFENNHLIEYCHELSDKIDSGGKNWISKNTYNTSTTYNICGDPNFNQINNWIYNEVDSFVKEIGFEGFDKSKNWGWFNNYNKKVFDFLEKHNITPVIVPFRHRWVWDGGVHCVTQDLYRERLYT